MDKSINDNTVYPDFSSTTNNDSDIIVLDDDENGDQYMAEVWFSDMEENLDDLVDEIVINKDIYKDMNCDSGEIMTSDQELESVTENCNHPTTASGNCPKCDKCEVTQSYHVVDQRGCDKDIRADSSGEDNDNLVQQTQQQQKQFQKQETQQNKPTMQTVEAENNEQEHVILKIEKYFKGENAEHEIIYISCKVTKKAHCEMIYIH